MTPLLKALGALLTYPDRELRCALPELATAIGDSTLLPALVKQQLGELIGEMASTDGYELEERYVDLFDRGRATSLHLFEHVHGESRDRGQAMVSLREIYLRGGFELGPAELPDYLPALLEFLAYAPPEQVQEMLADCAHILRAIGEALAARGSRHHAVLAALLAIAGEPGLDPSRAARKRPPAPALDEEWQEPAALGPAADCGIACTSADGFATPADLVPRVFQC